MKLYITSLHWLGYVWFIALSHTNSCLPNNFPVQLLMIDGLSCLLSFSDAANVPFPRAQKKITEYGTTKRKLDCPF